MSETAQVLIAQIQPEKHGQTNAGKAWTRFAFKDGNGSFYSTFDRGVFQPALELVGQTAKVTYTVKDDYKTITLIEPVAQNGDQGREHYEQRMDEVGLRKTRSAFWNAYIGSQLAASIYLKASGAEGIDPLDTVVRLGTRLMVHAEQDIFDRPAGDDGIPFEVPEP